MPIWTGATYNNTLIASTTSKLHKSGAIQEQVANRNSYLRVLLELKKNAVNTPPKSFAFGHIKDAKGKEIKIRLLGKDNRGAILARGSAELAASTPTVFDGIGAVTVRTAPYFKKQYIPGSEMEEIQGKESETASLVEDYLKALVEGEVNYLAAEVLSANLPSATAIGGLRSMISDGLTTAERGGSGPNESAFNSYLLTRNDADNAFWRAGVEPIGATLTLPLLAAAMTKTEGRGGQLDLGVCTEAHFGTIKQLVEAFTQVNQNDSITKLGARHVWYSGVCFIPDALPVSSELFLLDSRTIHMYQDKVRNVTNGIERDTSKENAYFMDMRTYYQHVCDRPRSNAKVVIA